MESTSVDTPVKVTVAIDYFKTTGKWYSEGSFEMDLESIPASWRVRERVKEMRLEGTRPGLVDNSNCEFVWVVRVRYEGEEHAQFLFLPERLEKEGVKKPDLNSEWFGHVPGAEVRCVDCGCRVGTVAGTGWWMDSTGAWRSYDCARKAIAGELIVACKKLKAELDEWRCGTASVQNKPSTMKPQSWVASTPTKKR